MYTDNGKVRALIRAALNERSMERYILMWLGDTSGLNTYFESWALIRDNEASNLLPSIAAGLGSILFAITVDSSDLNVASVAETVSPKPTREIIIAVPTVSSSNERKSTSSTKRSQIISFEDDENATVANNNILKSTTPPATAVPLSHACLKYQEKEKLAKEKRKTIKTDSTYERIMNTTESICTNPTSNVVQCSETDYIEPESPTTIQIFNPNNETYPSPTSSFDFKESDSCVSKTTDGSSIASNATTHSSSSVQNPESLQPSQENSMHSSISSAHDSVAALRHMISMEGVYTSKIQELEKRCASLEEQVTALRL